MVATPTPASAGVETQLERDQKRANELELLRSMIWDPRPQRRFQYKLAATVASGIQASGTDAQHARLGATVAAELSLVKYCRHVELGGHASLSYLVGTEVSLSAEQWASLCLARHQFPLPGLELGHRLRWQMARRLSAPLRDLRRTASEETLSFYLSVIEPRSKDGTHRFAFVPMRLDFTFHLQGDDLPAIPEIEAGAVRYTWDSEPNRLDLDVLFMRLDSNGEVSAADIIGLEIFNAQLKLSSVELGADFGVDLGMLGTSEATGPTSVHTDLERSVTALKAGASVAVTLGPVRFGVSWARRMWTLPQKALVFEQRLATFVSWRPPRWRWFVEAEGFAARSTVYQVDDEQTAWTGGGELRWAYALGRFFRLGLSGEAARSYYAAPLVNALDEVDGTPRFGLRVMGFAAAQFDNSD
jgi:hypothetical protein